MALKISVTMEVVIAAEAARFPPSTSSIRFPPLGVPQCLDLRETRKLSSISEWLGAKHQGQARAAIFKLETAGGGILVPGRVLLVAATLKQHKEGEAWNVGSSSGWTAPQTTLYFCICDLLGICICTCLPPLSI